MAYTFNYNPEGTGFNYYQDGQPISREAFASANGIDPGNIDQWSYATIEKDNFAGDQSAYQPVSNTTVPAPTGGTATVNKPLNQGAVNNTNLAIQQIAPTLAAALAAENTSFGNTRSMYDASENQQRGQYGKSTETNQLNYDSNFMDSIRAGIRGLSGLVNILRGTGAAGGTAEDMVRDVVGGVTSNDIRGGADTQKANQMTLDSALSGFLSELKGKRQVAEDTFTNNTRAIQGNADTQLQDLYSKLAGFYGDAGNTAEANRYMTQAGSYTPSIAANTIKAVSPYDTSPVAVRAPELTAFAEPSQPNAISAPQNGQVGSGIFAITKPKRERNDSLLTPALAGA